MFDSVPVIGLVNQSQTKVDMEQLAQALRYLADLLAAVWNAPTDVAVLAPGSSLPLPWVWPLLVLDRDGQQDALGHHTLEGTRPTGYVGVLDAEAAQVVLSVDVAHEFVEMRVNPTIQLVFPGYGGTAYLGEIADPVQGATFKAPNGVEVCNFVYPAWFGLHNPPGADPARYDHMALLSRPFECLPAGYCQVYSPGSGWTSCFGGPAGQQAAMTKVNSPHSRLGRPAGQPYRPAGQPYQPYQPAGQPYRRPA